MTLKPIPSIEGTRTIRGEISPCAPVWLAAWVAVILTAWMFFLPLSVRAADSGDSTLEAERAKTINSLTQKKIDTGIIIYITGDGILDRYEVRSLYDPPRLIVDIQGVTFPGGQDIYTCPDDSIRRVRINQANPGRTRLVFDFNGITGPAHHITQQGNILKLEFSRRKGEDTIPQVKIIKPEGNITIRAGKEVSFAGLISGGNEPFLGEWSFSGNGMRYITRQLDTYRFNQPGLYTLTYHVTDQDGDTASDSITVMVHDKSDRPVQLPETNRDRIQQDYSIGLNLSAGFYHAGAVDNFTIVQTGEAGDATWSLPTKDRFMISLGTDYQITPWLGLNTDFSGIIGDPDVNLILASAGPVIMIPSAEGLRPYLRAAFTGGHLDWNGVPGNFENGFGWEFGYGLIWSAENWNFGLDISARNIGFDYNCPDAGNVNASRDSIDFSGQAISLSSTYLF